MLAVTDVSHSGQNNGQSTAQSNLIASVVAQQKVIAAQRSNDNADAGSNSLSKGQQPKDKAAQKQQEAARSADDKMDDRAEASVAEARSLIEAQEASEADEKVQAAYIGRHSFNDLLSVIRDPHDQVLPNEPDGLGA